MIDLNVYSMCREKKMEAMKTYFQAYLCTLGGKFYLEKKYIIRQGGGRGAIFRFWKKNKMNWTDCIFFNLKT